MFEGCSAKSCLLCDTRRRFDAAIRVLPGLSYKKIPWIPAEEHYEVCKFYLFLQAIIWGPEIFVLGKCFEILYPFLVGSFQIQIAQWEPRLVLIISSVVIIIVGFPILEASAIWWCWKVPGGCCHKVRWRVDQHHVLASGSLTYKKEIFQASSSTWFTQFQSKFCAIVTCYMTSMSLITAANHAQLTFSITILIP